MRRASVSCRRIDDLDELFIGSVPAVVGIVSRSAYSMPGRESAMRKARAWGTRRNRVFTAPLRPLLGASSQTEASELRSRIEEKRVTIQAWAIFPKIREVDGMLRDHPGRRDIVREVHPEVCFYFTNRERPMSFHKKRSSGREERLVLLRSWCGDAIDEALASRRALRCAVEDIVDAFAALDRRARIQRASRDPSRCAADRPTGLRMEMVA